MQAHAEGRFVDLVAGKRRGPAVDLQLGLLTLLSWLYLAVIALRNLYYDLVGPAARRVEAPVISIGNLTTGGTGKTPMAIWVANQLAERGRRVAILTRGYKRQPVRPEEEREAGAWRGESDEALLLSRLCPRATIHIDANRVRAARRAIDTGSDVLVLDDGFQHRRLARDLDLVLVDATNPFGYGNLLPRGLLREPAAGLRRADAIVVTRSDLVPPDELRQLHALLERLSRGKPVYHARHEIAGFADLKGRPAPEVDAKAMQAVLFAGIGHFEPLRESVERLGAQVVAAYRYPDHHDYSDAELAQLPEVAMQLDANALLTTEKDAVKLIGRWRDDTMPLLTLRLRMTLEGDAEPRLLERIDAALRRRGGAA